MTRLSSESESAQVAGGAPICVRVSTALAMLGIRKTKMYELIASGEIEAIKIGRSTLVLRESLEAYVARAPRL